MYLTTTDVTNPYSRRATLGEIRKLKQWIKKSKPDTLDFNFKDDMYAQKSLNNMIHFKSRETDAYLFAYVPADFVSSL